MPLYVACGDHVLVAKVRTLNRDGADGALEVLINLVARIHARWTNTRMIVRADSGFARDPIMTWCERNGLYYLFGLAKNARLLKRIRLQQYEAHHLNEAQNHAARVFTEFRYRTRDSWSKARRVVDEAEDLSKGANPRFVVTNPAGHEWHSRKLYKDLYCARGDMENRIKEQQLDL